MLVRFLVVLLQLVSSRSWWWLLLCQVVVVVSTTVSATEVGRCEQLEQHCILTAQLYYVNQAGLCECRPCDWCQAQVQDTSNNNNCSYYCADEQQLATPLGTQAKLLIFVCFFALLILSALLLFVYRQCRKHSRLAKCKQLLPAIRSPAPASVEVGRPVQQQQQQLPLLLRVPMPRHLSVISERSCDCDEQTSDWFSSSEFESVKATTPTATNAPRLSLSSSVFV